MDTLQLIRQHPVLRQLPPPEMADFRNELDALAADPALSPLLRPELLLSLKTLLDRLLAYQLPFQQALRSAGAGALTHTFLRQPGCPLPARPGAHPVLLGLLLRFPDSGFAQELAQSGLLESFHLWQLDRLLHWHTDKIRCALDMATHFGHDWPVPERDLALDILHVLPVAALPDRWPAHTGLCPAAEALPCFIKEVFPLFQARFDEVGPAEAWLMQVERLADWLGVWYRHLTRSEPDFPENDVYYLQPFATIVQYVPQYVWWHNGLCYAGGEKHFHFGSPEFRHLALGGSVRQLADGRPFTRRMGHLLVHLPYVMEPGDTDMYLHLYAAAYGAGPLLNHLLQGYLRHPQDPERLREHLERWNPMIQKLADPVFEALEEPAARELLGYIAHILRDQPKTQLSALSLARLLDNSRLFYRRIRDRQELREQRLRERRLQAELEKGRAWRPHAFIRPFVDESGMYEIVELNTEEDLKDEGRDMNHCVASYAASCVAGTSSIWSLRLKAKFGRGTSLATIQVVNYHIVQVSARFNATPEKAHLRLITKWAFCEKLRSPTINGDEC
jgi:hypothetical protein